MYLGELIGGIIIGPTVLGFFAPGFCNALFPANPSIAQERDVLLTVGMLFFLFSAGLEINLTQVQQRKWEIEMILAAVALEHGLIDQRIFVALVTMALVTSMASAPLMQLLMKKTLKTHV